MAYQLFKCKGGADSVWQCARTLYEAWKIENVLAFFYSSNSQCDFIIIILIISHIKLFHYMYNNVILLEKQFIIVKYLIAVAEQLSQEKESLYKSSRRKQSYIIYFIWIWYVITNYN